MTRAYQGAAILKRSIFIGLSFIEVAMKLLRFNRQYWIDTCNEWVGQRYSMGDCCAGNRFLSSSPIMQQGVFRSLRSGLPKHPILFLDIISCSVRFTPFCMADMSPSIFFQERIPRQMASHSRHCLFCLLFTSRYSLLAMVKGGIPISIKFMESHGTGSQRLASAPLAHFRTIIPGSHFS